MEGSIVVCVCNADASVVPLGVQTAVYNGVKVFLKSNLPKAVFIAHGLPFNFTVNLDLFRKACRNNRTLLKVS